MGEEGVTFRELLVSYDDALGTDSSGSRFVVGDWGALLSAALPVADLAAGSIAALAAAVDRFSAAVGLTTRVWSLDPARITASFAGDRMMRIGDLPVQGFAELSGFFPCADGWIRTHANYPHHRSALTAVLGLAPDADASTAISRIRSLPGQEIEDRCAAGGAVAVRVRTEAEWSMQPGQVTNSDPLVVGAFRDDDSEPRNRLDRSAVTADAPLNGLRVLDMTRVVAGPVATRALALLGADVLRIDPPHLPEIDWQHLENGQGKRTSLLDLRRSPDADTFRRLLADADVLVTGYRPGALERLGVAEASGGVVCGRVSAWGDGSWRDRRGFDSIVQAATGIAVVEGTTERPGALPAQALDHSSGYLLAAAIVDSLAAQALGRPAMDVSVSLARTGAWLRGLAGRVETPCAPSLPGPDTTVTHSGIRTARPASSAFEDYRAPAHPWGTDQPAFY